ncbi:hypothetical protein J3R82DRAFT_5169 [Butyriboletus roseoflavus]|nr:hypothetical protein J3R82DRAFT_5169 [Butyriboletus roseoflavus]
MCPRQGLFICLTRSDISFAKRYRRGRQSVLVYDHISSSVIHSIEVSRRGAVRNNAEQLGGFTSRVAGLWGQEPLVIVALDECKDVWRLLQALVASKSELRLVVTSQPPRVTFWVFQSSRGMMRQTGDWQTWMLPARRRVREGDMN